MLRSFIQIEDDLGDALHAGPVLTELVTAQVFVGAGAFGGSLGWEQAFLSKRRP